MTNLIGSSISHFKILEKLGEGGMGVVYKAEDTRLDRLVALKFLPSQLTSSESMKARFLQEAKAASAINHPNICVVYDIQAHEGRQFIVMEYVEGRELRDIIDANLPNTLNLQEVIDFATQIAEGLQAAHEQEIIHRDIKSSNIMVTEKGQVKIMDFGLAKLKGAAKITKSTSTLGTIAYMSPEQIKGEKVDPRSDIFSFGVVVYEMLTGQLPFRGEYESAVMYSIVNEEPESVANLRPEVPVALESITKKALAKNPDERYQNINEMLAELKNRDLQPTPDKRTARQTVDKGSLKKRLTKIMAPVAVVLLFVLGFILFKPSLEKTSTQGPIPIAVITFKNQSGDSAYNYLQDVIPNLLICSLGESPYYRVLSWERMHDLVAQMGQNVDVIDSDLGFKVCQMDSVELLVMGSLTGAGDFFITEAKVYDVATKRILKSATSRGSGAQSILEKQIDEIVEKICSGAGIIEKQLALQRRPVRDITTSSMKAYRYFIKGRDEFERFHGEEAKEFFEKAIALDSTFASAYYYLCCAHDLLGDIPACKEALKKAKAYAWKVTEKERNVIDAYYFWDIENNPDKGINILHQMLKKYPKDKWVHLNLGDYYQNYKEPKDYDKALEHYLKALKLDPKFAWACSRADIIYELRGDYEAALKIVNQWTSYHPTEVRPFMRTGNMYRLTWKYDQALEAYNKALELNPKSASAIYGLARTYFRLGNIDEAIAKFKEASKIDPGHPVWRIGYIYAMKENYLEAMKWIDKQIARSPSPGHREAAKGFFWKSFYYAWLGKLDQAIAELDKAREIWKSENASWDLSYVEWLEGYIHYDRGNFELSQQHFKNWYPLVKCAQDMQQLFPVCKIMSLYALGSVDLRKGHIDSARSKLSFVKYMLPEIIPRYQGWVTDFYNWFQYEVFVAEASFEKAIAIGEKLIPGDDPSSHLSDLMYRNTLFLQDVLAQAYQQNRELDKAIAEYEKLLTFDPNSSDRRLIHPKMHYRLAKLYEEKGTTDKAIKEYEKFLEIWKDADKDLPELVDAKKRLAKLKRGS